jgi:hypothetical protein
MGHGRRPSAANATLHLSARDQRGIALSAAPFATSRVKMGDRCAPGGEVVGSRATAKATNSNPRQYWPRSFASVVPALAQINGRRCRFGHPLARQQAIGPIVIGQRRPPKAS